MEVSTEELVRNFTFPDHIKVEPIEKFIQAKHPEVQKLILHLLKPTLVVENGDFVEIIFEGENYAN